MSQIKQVKDAIDIVEIVGERVELQRSGANLKGLCPFHSEKSPSFFVSPTIQRYRCFGCGESGDVFNFLEKYEGMSFGEVLKMLADRAGIELKDYKHSPEDELRERLFKILDLAKEYFHYLLVEHEVGQPAREYLKQRGISKQSIKLFQLGYALHGWDGLIKYLHHKKKFALSDLVKAGLVIKNRSGRYYDRFRGRVMFPLTNHRGKVVGFSGRTLVKDAKEAKYINTPETMLYHKSELLYGYSHLYRQIREAEEVIIAEGEMDVISSVQAHVNNIVAIKGSALTREQLQLLRRTVNRLLLSLDMDEAGIEATKRAITLAQECDLELRVLQLPKVAGKAKDPDELARSDPRAWRETAKSSISVYEFFLRNALAAADPQTPEGKRTIINQLAPIFGNISHEVEKDFYIKKLAEALDVSNQTISKDIQKFKDRDKVLVKKPAKQTKPSSAKKNRQQNLEEYCLFLLLRYQEVPGWVTESGADFAQLLPELDAIVWQSTGFKQIVAALQNWQHKFDLAKFTHSLPTDLQQVVSDIYLHEEYIHALEKIDFQKEWKQTIIDLKRLAHTNTIKRITRELDALDAKRNKTAQDEARQQELLQQIVLLKRK